MAFVGGHFMQALKSQVRIHFPPTYLPHSVDGHATIWSACNNVKLSINQFLSLHRAKCTHSKGTSSACDGPIGIWHAASAWLVLGIRWWTLLFSLEIHFQIQYVRDIEFPLDQIKTLQRRRTNDINKFDPNETSAAYSVEIQSMSPYFLH